MNIFLKIYYSCSDVDVQCIITLLKHYAKSMFFLEAEHHINQF